MNEYIFLRTSESDFKWVTKNDVDTTRSKFAHKINLTMRSSKYSTFNQPVYIISYIGESQPTSTNKKPGVVELYKSGLQKAVRRKKAPEAVEIGKRLWELRPFEMIRRLMIIMCEDVIITTDYIWLSWLLMALSKGYKPIEWDYNNLISLVEWMCKCSYRDILNYSDTSIHDCEFGAHENSCILKSILVRIGYGGMKNDVAMLENFYDLWWARFQRGVQPFNRCGTSHKVEYTPIEHPILPEAVDHHCSKICEYIKMRVDIPIEKIRNLIWDNRSSINYRKFIKSVELDVITIELEQSPKKSCKDYESLTELIDEYSRMFIASYNL